MSELLPLPVRLQGGASSACEPVAASYSRQAGRQAGRAVRHLWRKLLNRKRKTFPPLLYRQLTPQCRLCILAAHQTTRLQGVTETCWNAAGLRRAEPSSLQTSELCTAPSHMWWACKAPPSHWALACRLLSHPTTPSIGSRPPRARPVPRELRERKCLAHL